MCSIINSPSIEITSALDESQPHAGNTVTNDPWRESTPLLIPADYLRDDRMLPGCQARRKGENMSFINRSMISIRRFTDVEELEA